MIKKSTLLHLRIPFSIYLLPVFLFAVSQAGQIIPLNLILVFFILHILVYPASNGYNSFYDKDEDSIGGLEKPPAVTWELLYVSLLMELAAFLTGLIISFEFALMIVLYGLASKAYSHNKIRLKKYPYIGWLTAVFFQGAFTYVVVFAAISGLTLIEALIPQVLTPAVITSIMLGGFYPMTQVYQHEEDKARGDMTISRKLGIKGTFLLAAIMFVIADAGYYYYFLKYYSIKPFLIMQLFLMPLTVFFFGWFAQVIQDTSYADFKNTMRLNKVSSFCLIGFFLLFWLIYS